jgi:CheY-like chemotaxis protein
MGFRVVEAADGTEVMRLVEAHRPVLVILDLGMPEKGGVDVLTELRADPRFRGLPVIVLTAAADQGTVRKVAKLKANGYLLKENLTVGKMRERIRAVLGKGAVPSATRKTASTAGTDAAAAESKPTEPVGDGEGMTGVMVDRAELLERVDNDIELLKHLVELFLRDTPGLVESMQQAIANHQREELQRAAHTLKGMLGNLSAGPVAQMTERLERMGQQDQFAGIESALEELKAALTPLSEELRRIV